MPSYTNTQLDGYCLYVAAVRRVLPEAHGMNREAIAEFVLEVMAYFGVIVLTDLEPQQREELVQQITVMIA